jgi:hypothetical protein
VSWKHSTHFWALGAWDVHVFYHALDPGPRYVTLGGKVFGRWCEWWVWPLHATRKWRAHTRSAA